MRHISDGHEFRPRGGLLLVTTIHFYLYRYFPGAIDRARMHATESENRHAAKSHLRRPASGPLARLKSFHRGWWSPLAGWRGPSAEYLRRQPALRHLACVRAAPVARCPSAPSAQHPFSLHDHRAPFALALQDAWHRAPTPYQDRSHDRAARDPWVLSALGRVPRRACVDTAPEAS